MVLAATTPIRPSAASELPALNPNQPKARMKVPRITNGMLCARIGCGLPLTYLPMRGPRIIDVTSASTPPCMWTTEEPA